MATNTEIVVVETPWARSLEEVFAEGQALGGQVSPNENLLGNRDFFRKKSLDELAREQGVGPVNDISVFAGGIPDDEDVDKLVAQLEELRGS